MALAFGGKISFDPTRDSIPLPAGGSFRFSPPQGEELPKKGHAVSHLFLNLSVHRATCILG